MGEPQHPAAARQIVLRVNGQEHTLRLEPRVTLLSALREHLDLTGAKPACERGECGACTVLLDGKPVNACHLLAMQAVGHELWTLEGLQARPDFAPLREAFVAEDGGQCGYCTPGFAVAAYAALQRGVRDAMALRWELVGHICRCNAYESILSAIVAAGSALPTEDAP